MSRAQGGALVCLYVAYVAVIWRLEGAPPAIGEAAEVAEAEGRARSDPRAPDRRRVGRDLLVALVGILAMSAGATMAVEAVRHLAPADASQASISLTLVGFATAFELVVLAWAAARRGAGEAVVAAVVGSFAYNATMTLGASALVRPLRISGAGQLHGPVVVMVLALGAGIGLSWNRGYLSRAAGGALLACYPLFVGVVLVSG